MLDFTFHNPGKILFGESQLSKLGKEIKPYSSKILLVYGGGTIIRNGLHEKVTFFLKQNDIEFVELPGVQPNPRIESVREGIKLCREHDLSFILAVGGGSVIDCAKVIAAGYYYENDPWDFFTGQARITDALPIGTVLTIAASGTEMNVNAVITNDETKEKKGVGSAKLIPRFSILDPLLTFTVPRAQTAAGVVDTMSHIFEQYFSPTPDTFLQDRMCEAVLKTCIEYGPLAYSQPGYYVARANLMWASTLALNGLLSTGKLTDWATHMIEHEVSAVHDTTHGQGLAVLIPHWMEYVLDDNTAKKLALYARNVWDIVETDDMKAAQAGITATKKFFNSLELPSTLSEVGVTAESLAQIAENAVARGDLGRFKRLDKEAVLTILQKAF